MVAKRKKTYAAIFHGLIDYLASIAKKFHTGVLIKRL